MTEIEKLNKKIKCLRKRLDRIKWNCNHHRYTELAESLEQTRAYKAILVEGKKE